MRLLLDVNILISYLLAPQADSPVTRVVQAAVLGKFVLLLPAELMQEMRTKLANKSYLSARISHDEAVRFAAILGDIGETIPRIEGPIPAITRDPKDNYLLAYAVAGQADYLITGDADLLVLRKVGTVSICSPRTIVDAFGW